jgi:hypothetical protein
MKTTQKRNTLFLAGVFGMVLAFGLVLAGCPTDSDSGGGGTPNFDGASLAGTTWVVEDTEELMPGLSVGIKGTLTFNTDTAGAITFEAVSWSSGWDEEMKAKIGGMITSDNGPFTFTYDAADHTGEITESSGDTMTFTVDVDKRELTSTSIDEDDETETMVFKLQ